MTFPFIYRKDHDEEIRLLNLIICDRDNRIGERDAKIANLESEVATLIQTMTEMAGPPVNTTLEPRKRPEVHLQGRGGFRHRAQMRSRDTIKPPADSAARLEEKVKREGGV